MTKVLVIDDQAQIRKLICRILKAEHMEVFEVSNHLAALQLLQATEGDSWVVLIDLTMPEMNGIDLAEAIVELNSCCRVGIMSGFDRDDIISSQGHRPSDLPFLSKPFNRGELLAFVNTL